MWATLPAFGYRFVAGVCMRQSCWLPWGNLVVFSSPSRLRFRNPRTQKSARSRSRQVTVKLRYRRPWIRACSIVAMGLVVTVTLPAVSCSHEPATTRALLEQFQNTQFFWEQFELAQRIVALHDRSVLPSLAPYLSNEDRHLRGNAAFVFARLGDDKGFDVIVSIL